MGVAMVVSIDLANESARRAFILSAQTLSGKATHQIIGGSKGLPAELYRTLRVDAGVELATPIIEGYISTPDFKRTFQLLGIDPFSADYRTRYFPDDTTKCSEHGYENRRYIKNRVRRCAACIEINWCA